MFNTIGTLIRATFAEADVELSRSSAATLLAQHLRDAKAELAARKSRLAQLMAQQMRERRELAEQRSKVETRWKEARTALAAEQEELAKAIADDILRLQDRLTEREHEDRRITDGIDRARADLEEAERLFAELSNQLRLSRTRPLSARGNGLALKRAEAAARTLAERDQTDEDLSEAFQRLDGSAHEQDIDARLAASGLFDTSNERRDEIIAQLRIETKGDPR